MTDKTEEAKTEEKQEEKSVAEVRSLSDEPKYQWIPDDVTSFADLMAMEKAQDQAVKAANLASQFKALIENIFANEDIDNKAQAVQALATEFADLIEQGQMNKEVKLDHYKEVSEQAEKAIDNDFQGGCERCGFGTKEALKEFSKCPYCWEALSEPV